MIFLNSAFWPAKGIGSKTQSGVSLVELMIALGVSAVVISGTMLFMANTERSRDLLDQMATRDSIATKLSQTAGLPAAIATAMGSNAALNSCVMGNNTNTACNAAITNPNTQRAFELSIPMGTAGIAKVAGLPPGPPIPASPPIYYDLKGRPSTQPESLCRTGATIAPSKRCPFIALSTYWASCPNNAPTCPFAAFINVRYQLKMWQAPTGTPTADLPFGGFNMANIPPDPDFTADPTAFAVPVSADQIRKYGGSVCTSFHPLAIINGDPSMVTTSNSPVCVCPKGFIRQPASLMDQLTNCIPDPLENKVCRDTGTGEKCLMVGIRRNNIPVCRTVAERTACKNIDLSANEDCIVNGAPGWMEQIDVGICRVIQPPPASKKAATGEIEISCDRSIGRCCNFTRTILQSQVNNTACGT